MPAPDADRALCGPAVGDLVVVRPPETLAAFLEARGYLARDVPLLKHIAALPGQGVCRTGRTITVDGVTMGHALDHDHPGRILPGWQGCLGLADDEVFLMNFRSENSLDGRYFGPLPVSAIVGHADLLWTEERN
jgi:type IV secretory pathway protease TraF